MTDTPEWNDDAMDERVREMARGYNRPVGAVPREEMWAAIAPALRAQRVVNIASRRHFRSAPVAWAAALAAAMVLGVVLERNVFSARSPAAVAVGANDHRPLVAAAEPTSRPAEPAATEPATRVASTGQRGVAAPSVPRVDVRKRSGDAGLAPDSRMLYRAAARQTLVQAEALLTAYRAGDDPGRDRESIRQAGRWARDVLTSTRLLLDSPAANDPQFRALFTDLELVLAQIVQLSGAPLQADERDLIERSMRERDLLPRLRSVLPAGATAS